MDSSSISDDIRKSVQNGLSLECDAKLLQYMELISNKLIDRAKTTSNNIDTMSSQLQRTSISLDNVINRLSSLSHTKFVENRVYEDDETIANIKEVPVEIKTKEYNPIKTLNTVIKNNMKMLDNCYEKVSVELDDSDEEDELIKSIVYRPKNKYESRPVPHLIGSKEWKEKWHIGIYDSDESFSENENEEFSDGSDSISLPSNGPTISESGSSVWSVNRNSKTNIIANKRNDYTSSDDEMSTTSKTSSSDNKQQRIIKNIPPQIPPAPEQRYYVHQPKEKGLFDESSESENESRKIYHSDIKKNTPELLPRKQQSVVSTKISNIFNDEPPKLDGAVIEQKNNRIPSIIFCNSDEDKLIKKNEPKIENTAQIHISQSDNVRKKTVNLFDDDDFNSFMQELDKKTSEKIVKVEDKKINLFDDQNKEEIKSIIKNIPTRKVNLFDDQIEEVNKPNQKTTENFNKNQKTYSNKIAVEINASKITSSHKKPAGNLSDSKNIEKNVRTNLFEEEEDDDDLFSSTIKPTNNALEKTILGISKTKIANLFDDTPPDDDFDNLFKPSTNTTNRLNSEVNTISSIPALSSDIQNSLNISGMSKGAKKNIFIDDVFDDNESIFKIPTDYVKNSLEGSSSFNQSLNDTETIIEQTLKNISETENTNQPSKYESIINEKTFSSSLFDDAPEDDDFFKSIVNTQEDNKISEDNAKINKDKEEVLDNISEKTENKTISEKTENKTNFPNNNNNTSTQIELLDDQTTNKSPNNKFLFSDQPPLDDYENMQDISNESNKNDENNIDTASKMAVIKISNNHELNFENHEETIGDSEQFMKLDVEKNNEIISNIDSTVSKQSLNKLTIHSVFMPTIFDDTPPDDNDDIFSSPTKINSNETDIIESTSDNCSFDKRIQNISSVSNYDSVVFQDTIPPDDNQNIISTSKENNDELTKSSIQNIIIDNTFIDNPRIHEKTEFKKNFIFDDEPPTDIFNNNEKNKIEENMESKKSEIIEEQSITISDLIKKASNVSKQFDAGKSNLKPKLGPNKLSTNLNINVAALIPGAKRPILSSANSDESDGGLITKLSPSNFGEKCENVVNEKNVEKAQAIDIPSEENRLISLNKNRAKVPQSKRPSTKRGRLENYRKSLADNNNINYAEETDNINTNIQINYERKKTEIEEEVIKSPVFENSMISDKTIENNSCITKSMDNKEIFNKFEPETDKEYLHESHGKFNLISQSDIQTVQNLPFLFTDNNDDDDDWLFKSTSKSNKYEDENVLNSDRVDDNFYDFDNPLQPALKNASPNAIKHDLNKNSSLTNTTDIKHKTKLLSTDKKNNDDWLLNATSQSSVNMFKGDTSINLQTEKVHDPLFFDEQNDDDDVNDLFSNNSLKSRKNEIITNNNTTENNIKSTETFENITNKDEIFKKIKIYKKKSINKEPIQEPVIGNKTIQKSIKPIDKLKNKSIGLFDSDDDNDEDNLFGNNSSNTKISIKKNTPTTESNKKFLNVPKRDNLFDDTDEDDDDLFGTNISKVQSTTVTKKIIEKPKINQSPGESAGYNPLADLLNEK